MLTESKMPNKFSDTPREKPQGERADHGNLERPGAQAHPRARSGRDWSHYTQPAGWRLH